MLIKLTNGQTHEHNNIKKIVIYGNGAIKYTTNNGYFEEIRINAKNKIQSVYDGRPAWITLNSEPKRARKENLNRKDNYILTYRGRYSFDSGYALYIHESEINAEAVGEYISSAIAGEINYKNVVKLSFTHGATMKRCKLEDVENAGDDFTPPEGCRWASHYSNDPQHPNYDVIRAPAWVKVKDEPTRVVKRWLEEETLTELLVSTDGYSRTEKDNERQRREELAKLINEKKIFRNDISHYDIENLLKYFDITPKKEEVTQ